MSTCEIAGTPVGYVLINCLLETSPWGLEWPESALFACAELVFKRSWCLNAGQDGARGEGRGQ